ncbi:uncharacterized protein LOC115227611 [Octopus sinensis]|uniref:Uncharacterized protein LOC115227611 n=1 Tax=Octopus sinensis TaxID=2607531 RepID=A0A7E6EGU9_9MOLL|nr:uncharacterized protein LOC115227611 [Octopus sinensis]
MANIGEGRPCNGMPCLLEQDEDPKELSELSKTLADYQAARERINSRLHKIRLELSEIRDQDVKLLKQLIQISETIKKLSDDRLSKRRTWYGQRQSICSETSDIYLDLVSRSPDMDELREAMIFRQFSEPTSFSREIYLDPTASTAIFDASVHLTNGNHNKEPQQNWGMDLSKVPLRHRPHSVAIVCEKTYSMDSSQEWLFKNDKSYAELLERSIRLWKSRRCDSQSDENDEKVLSLINEYMKSEQNQKSTSDQIKCLSKDDTSKKDYCDVAESAAAEATESELETANFVGDKDVVRSLSRSSGTSFNLCGQSDSVEKLEEENVFRKDVEKDVDSKVSSRTTHSLFSGISSSSNSRNHSNNNTTNVTLSPQPTQQSVITEVKKNIR